MKLDKIRMVDVNIKGFLDQKVEEFNRPAFIENDPICIPHQFTNPQDIEIMGFFAAILAWGQRKTIINKCDELAMRFDGRPAEFIRSHTDSDLKRLLGFKHRTFNDTDLLYFVSFLNYHYNRFESLEDAFLQFLPGHDVFIMENSINSFKDYFFSLADHPIRTMKHVSSPQRKSSCKRLNMYLRWMVRNDDRGVDFGIWRRISPKDLVSPCDVHVERVARKFGLITEKKVSWKMAIELTENLRQFDPMDPVKYDFALFGMGVEGEL